VFLDETSAATNMARRYGWAPRGERCRLAAPWRWEWLLSLTQERGVQLRTVFLDDTNIRAHQKVAGAAKRGI